MDVDKENLKENNLKKEDNNNLKDENKDNLKENNLKKEDNNNLMDVDKDNLKENNLKNEDKNNLKDENKDNLKENNLKNEDKNNLKDENKDNLKENYFDDPNLYLEKEISYKKLSNGTITSNFLNKLQLNYESFSFNNYSIFNTNSEKIKKDKEYIQNLLTNYIKTNKMETSLNKLENGALGTMLGMGIADSMGHRFEFQPLRYNTITLRDMGEGQGGSFRLLPGQWTDDTSMGLCLADSLIVKNGEYDAHDLMHRFLCWWYGGYNNAFRFDNSRNHSCGLGGMISESFEYYINSPKEQTEAGDKNSSGIGSIMRNAAVPICFHNDLNKAMKIAELQSYTTHHGDEAAECCRLLTFIVIKIFNRKNETLQEIIENLNDFKTPVFSVQCLAQSKEENDSPDRDWNWKKKDFKYSPTRARSQPGYIGSYAMDGMAMALHVVYYTNSFEEAVIKVVNLRGDSDSVGAVVGQIAGAYYGVDHIPPKWIEVISEWDHFEIPLRGYILSKINK
jgi:ADP-ribosylglycohydrolase